MYSLKDNQQTTLRVHALDLALNEAAFPGVPSWRLEGPPDLVTLTPAPDGMTCLMASTGKLGRGAVVASTPGALGTFPPPLSKRWEFEVTTDVMASLNILADEPELRADLKPAPPAPPPEPPAPVDPSAPSSGGSPSAGPSSDTPPPSSGGGPPIDPNAGQASQAIPAATV